jgi:hypothetical protein
MKRLLGFLILVAIMLATTSSPRASAQEPCRFVQGFAAVRERIGAAKVGACLEDERVNSENGNTEQRTSRGLLVWRKVDSITAFTDGGTTWVQGPDGLQTRPNSERFSWERDPVRPSGPTAVASPAPNPVVSRPASSPQAAPAATQAPAASPAASPVASPAGISVPPPSGAVGQRDPDAGVEPLNPTTCPDSHPIKGSQGSPDGEEWIYHTPRSRSYAATPPDRCFAAEADARAAGYRASET